MLVRPTLKTGRYALRIAKQYVRSATPMTLTENPHEARLFMSIYLEQTTWDWQYGHEAVSADALKRAQSDFDKSQGAKTGSTSKRLPCVILLLLWGLSAHAGGFRRAGSIAIGVYGAGPVVRVFPAAQQPMPSYPYMSIKARPLVAKPIALIQR